MHSFENVYGHEIITDSLKKILAKNTAAHAYIFDGVSGIGKSLLSEIFARGLQCEQKIKPCNECISCRATFASNHPDIIYVKAKGASIGVDDVREQINATVHIKPYQYKYKIFIVEKADKMTAQAQNALLKTLEEPPSYAVFLLHSQSVYNFLPTIISRCVILKLKPLALKQVRDYLKGKAYDEKESLAAASASGGSIGKALMLLADEGFKQERAEISAILNILPDSNLWDILLLAKKLEKFKDNKDSLLNFMHLWFRDALLQKSVDGFVNEDHIMQPDLISLTGEFGAKMSLKNLLSGIEAIINAAVHLKANGNYLLTMEVMLMKMTGVQYK